MLKWLLMVRNLVNTGSEGMRARRIHYISTLLDWLDLLSHHLVSKPKLAQKLLVNLTQKCQIKSKSRKDATSKVLTAFLAEP